MALRVEETRGNGSTRYTWIMVHVAHKVYTVDACVMSLTDIVTTSFASVAKIATCYFCRGTVLATHLEAFFELSSILGASDQSPHVQRHQLAVLQGLRHIASYNTLCKSFRDRGLSDTCPTDKASLSSIATGGPSATDFYLEKVFVGHVLEPRSAAYVRVDLTWAAGR